MSTKSIRQELLNELVTFCYLYNGSRRHAKPGEYIECLNPKTREILTELKSSDTQDMRNVFRDAPVRIRKKFVKLS